jgi:transposase
LAQHDLQRRSHGCRRCRHHLDGNKDALRAGSSGAITTWRASALLVALPDGPPPSVERRFRDSALGAEVAGREPATLPLLNQPSPQPLLVLVARACSWHGPVPPWNELSGSSITWAARCGRPDGKDKYHDHLPLYRSEGRLARLGVTLPRSTMCDWMAACAVLLTPLYQVLVQWVLQSKVLHTDDTTVPVRDETQSTNRYGRLWDYIGDADHPGVVFDYTPTHARHGPAAFLKSFTGFLQADAYGGYDGIYTGSAGLIIEVACWAHARHKFHEAQGTDPERALAAKAWVRQLYDVEDEATAEIARLQLVGTAAAAVRLRLRQAKSVPLLTSFQRWLLDQKAQVLPKSPNATAINYTLNQWEALNRYTTDGDLHIDNNISERTLKLIGIGRNNWLFVGSDQGGKTAAVLFSFTATCKHLKLDPFAYLRDVLERLPTHPADRLEDLLPHCWQAARLAAAATSTRGGERNAPTQLPTLSSGSD